jgi:hypothetical protein
MLVTSERPEETEMDEQQPNMTNDPGPAEQGEGAGGGPSAGEGDGGHGTSESSRGREWLTELETMIEGIAREAAPTVRAIAAKAAELAAVAGDKAGPFAERAAEVTGEAGKVIAERSRALAVELRRDQPGAGDDGSEPTGAAADTTPATETDGGPVA